MAEVAVQESVRASVSCEIVGTPDRFRQLECAWQRLWMVGDGCVFQSYYWIEAWWSTSTIDSSLCIALAWSEQNLIGILPFIIRRWAGIRILEWAAQAVSDYCGSIGEQPEVLRRLWEEVGKTGGFDIIRLRNVHPDSMIAGVFAGAMKCQQDAGDICLNLTNEWTNGEHWFRSQNKKKRNNFSRGRRMLTQEGELVFQQITEAPDPKLLEQLVEMKRQSIAANGIRSSGNARGLVGLTRALERLQALRIFLVTCNDKVIAASINAVQGKVLLAYFAVYDAAFARASPGILLMTEYTRWAFDAGFTKVDYLRGEETYKFEFANDVVRLNSYIEAATYIGHASLASHALWRSARRLMTSRQMPKDPEIGSAYTTKAGNIRYTPPRPVVATID